MLSKFHKFSGWLAASTVLLSTQSVLSTQAMLQMLTLGSTEAQVFNFVGRDVLGQLGGLAVMIGLTKRIDKNPHKFVWFAHAMQQSSMLLLLSTPHLPVQFFLPVSALSNVFMNVSFIGYGSLSAKCIQKFSDGSNMGEMYSKLTIHQTLASTLGLSLGILCTETSTALPNACFVALGIARVFCYQKAVTKVL